jgi:AAA domain
MNRTGRGTQEGRNGPPAADLGALAALLTLGQLTDRYQCLRPPVIHGLLRRGEVMNVIASSKVGKSWLVIDLALAVATGAYWLGIFPCDKGGVLLIDNELHAETLADRVRRVAEARGVPLTAVRKAVSVLPLRGRLTDVLSLAPMFRALPRRRFNLIALDTLYRMLPPGMSENDNAAMANVYNAIDSYADLLGSSFTAIHHASKGAQAEKAITDVGAGAGSQSRAVDTHLILRPHAEEGAFVLEAAARSSPPLAPRCLRWKFPIWQPADDLDPTRLSRPQDRRRQADRAAREKEADGEVLKALDRLDPQRQGCSKQRLAEELGWHHEKLSAALARLHGEGILEVLSVSYVKGNGAEGSCLGVRRWPK